MSMRGGIQGARPTTPLTLGWAAQPIETAPPMEKPIIRVLRPCGSCTASSAAVASSMHCSRTFHDFTR